MAYIYEKDLVMGVLSGVLAGIPGILLGIACYVLTALALYVIARRRGIRRPWLAWIPVVNCWILGSLSDQYRYVVRGEIRSKRKALLILGILTLILGIMMAVLGATVLLQVIFGALRGVRDEQLVDAVMGALVGIAGLALPLAGVAIAYAIVRYMALYDVYKSLDPHNCVLFLVLSILFGVTEPFFLFFSRDKEDGMPPRRPSPTPQIPWDSGDQSPL